MKPWLVMFTTFTLLLTDCAAQQYFEPILGYQVDPNYSGRFQQINTGAQIAFRKSRMYEFIIRLQKSWGLPYHSADSSFTTNPALPLYSPTYKTINPGTWYLTIDHRFILGSKGKNHQFSILLQTGLSYENLKVTYQYDKNDYIILNPDKTQKGLNLSIGTGFEYMRKFKDNRLFLRLTVDGPLTGRNPNYPSSFNYMSPIAFNAGYSLLLKKKKHAK
jgi:hypothetical protein